MRFKLRDTSRFGFYEMFPNAFTPDECTSINTVFSRLPVQEALVRDDQGPDHEQRKALVRWIPPHPMTENVYKRLAKLIVEANNRLWEMRLEGFSSEIQHTEYHEVDAHYDWHMDWGPGYAKTRKLSISVQLSDPETYKGGDLEFMSFDVDPDVLRLQGTAIVFPSFLMHRVSPIIRGSRTSLVAWMDGPEFT